MQKGRSKNGNAQEEPINIEGGTIPVKLIKEEEEGKALYSVTIDNVLWLRTEQLHHAAIIFRLLADHVTEYMTYEKTN